MIPKNFLQDFNFFILIASEETWSKLNKKQNEGNVCSLQKSNSEITYLEYDPNATLIDKQYQMNPHSNLHIEENFDIKQTGVFFTILCLCPHVTELEVKSSISVKNYKVDRTKPYVEFEGTLVYKNPHGYLGQDQFLLMRYYFFMSLIYMGFLLFWVLKIFQNKQHLIFFHYVICTVFGIAFCETWFFYAHYDLFNRYGTMNYSVFYIASALTVIKMTSIVIITLIVSLGYKITRKSIFKYTLRLSVLGFVYFV